MSSLSPHTLSSLHSSHSLINTFYPHSCSVGSVFQDIVTAEQDNNARADAVLMPVYSVWVVFTIMNWLLVVVSPRILRGDDSTYGQNKYKVTGGL